MPIHRDGRRVEVSQGYGPRDDGSMHSGVDLLYRRRAGEPTSGATAATVRKQDPARDGGWFMPGGVPALAPSAGVVTSSSELFHPSGYSRGWGVRVDAGGGWAWFVNHIVIGTQRVRLGDSVAAGQELGEIGGSNDGHGLKHVHLALYRGGSSVDPEPYMRGWEHVQRGGGLGIVGGVALGIAGAWLLRRLG
ncbi:MAG: M23 family metallopeptidase [Gemmatimonadaceae bacterium]